MPSPLVYLTAVIFVGVLAQVIAARFKLPAILLLLGAGFALGRWAEPESLIPQELLSAAISLSVGVILFEGGLSLKFRELSESRVALVRLVTIGGLLTWVLSLLAGRLLVFETWSVAALAGAIYIVTGPTVIGPLLRHVRPHRRISAVAKWEGIVIDPIGASMAVLVYEAIQTGSEGTVLATVTIAMLRTLAAGLLCGLAGGLVIIVVLRRHLIPDYLHAPLLLAMVLGVFTLADIGQHEAGLLAVTVMGLLLANQKAVAIEHLTKFKENLGVLLISVLFIVLSARLRPQDLIDLGWGGAAFIALLILVIRPITVLAATYRTALTWQERVFVAWLAPRGIVAAAVASVFALELSHREAGPVADDARLLVPLTFSVIVTTVALYGLTARPFARWLKIADPDPQGLLIVGAHEVARTIAKVLTEEGFTVKLIDSNRENVMTARLAGLRVRHGNVLSESLLEELDLSGIGRLLAMTPNDEVNSLAAIAFTDTFERAGVYQLPTRDNDRRRKGEGGKNKTTARHLFAPEATYPVLTKRFRNGGTIKKTVLTEEFNYRSFQQQHGVRATVLFIINKANQLSVVSAEKPINPQPGQKLISLIEESEKAITAIPPEPELIGRANQTGAT